MARLAMQPPDFSDQIVHQKPLTTYNRNGKFFKDFILYDKKSQSMFYKFMIFEPK